MKYEEPECVKMKRRGAARIYETIKDMTLEERSEYWQKRSKEFREWLKEEKDRANKAEKTAKE